MGNRTYWRRGGREKRLVCNWNEKELSKEKKRN